MKVFEQLDRWKKVNYLIKEEKTGNPEEFSKKIGISTSHLFRCIEELKELGAPICYCRNRKTYFYEYDFELKVTYSVQLISNETLKTIFGGFSLKKNTSLLFYESKRI